jgi:hypothetical protein
MRGHGPLVGVQGEQAPHDFEFTPPPPQHHRQKKVLGKIRTSHMLN